MNTDPALWDRAWFGVLAAAVLLVVRAVLAALFPKGYYFRAMDRLLTKDPDKDPDDNEEDDA